MEYKEKEGISKRKSTKQLGHFHKILIIVVFMKIIKKNINNCKINRCNYNKVF